jgi:hypothetical protein
MARDGKSFIAIIGGFFDIKKNDPAKFGDAKKEATRIGEALAKADLGLVVYFSNEESLEPHVVNGYVKALPSGTAHKSIRVRFAESQKNVVRFAEQATHPDLFDRNIFPGNDWEAPFYRSLVDADGVDAVLLMAGARSTLIAGQIAVARPMPVLAVVACGGSAAINSTELATTRRDYPSSATHSIEDMVAWLKNECATRKQQIEKVVRAEKHYSELTSQQRKIVWAVGVVLAFIAAIGVGITGSTSPKWYPLVMLAGLVAAGATGAIVRSVFWGADHGAPLTSVVLGIVAGLVVGIAYLVPQWVGAPGVLAPSAASVEATDKIQFVSAVLVSVTAGIGFDTVFTRMKKEAETHGVGPPSQQKP